MDWKKELGAYFHFTRRDRIAILVILVLIFAVWALPRVIVPGNGQPDWVGDTSWVAEVRKMEIQVPGAVSPGEERDPAGYFERPSYTGSKRPAPELFPFDPNSATQQEWQRLGLREKTITTILRFREKGGRFRKTEDLQKVYGLFPDEYERLRPYVRIPEPASPIPEPSTPGPATERYKAREYAKVDINRADSAAWEALPGIGARLAGRIILFRDKLGGFHKIEQVGEVYGLADSVFQKIKSMLLMETTVLRKININNATIDDLKSHPYIRFQLAQTITAYRKEHGAFASVNDIKKMAGITEELFKKLVPYLTVE